MEEDARTQVERLTGNVADLGASVSRLWEMNTKGLPPHRVTMNMMVAILISSVFSAALGLFIVTELFLLLRRVNAIYSLML